MPEPKVKHAGQLVRAAQVDNGRAIRVYANVNSLIGGKFMTDDVTVTPKTNRLLAFGPGVHHGVEDFTGVRVAVAINAWATKPYAS
jgi:hypothetical protein